MYLFRKAAVRCRAALWGGVALGLLAGCGTTPAHLGDTEGRSSPLRGAGTGLLGEYFEGRDFGTSLLSRTDATVGFDWGSGSPGAGVPADDFSVRWNGQVQPLYSETYQFFTRSDDGVRLWIDGKKIIDNWTDHAAHEDRGEIALKAGRKYDVKMEYYEAAGAAVAKLSWASATQRKQIIPTSQLYLPGGEAGAVHATVTQEGDTATLHWTAASSPAEGWTVARDGVDSDGYGAWSGTAEGSAREFTFEHLVGGDTYTLTVSSSVGTASARVTLGAEPPPAGVTATVTQEGDTATLHWTAASSPAEGWTVARDGVDSDGYGAWSGTAEGSAREFTFEHLVGGDTYTLTVSSSVGTASAQVTLPGSTQPDPDPDPTPGDTSPGWLSGGAGDGMANGDFGSWRGSPVEIGQTWPDTPDLWSLQPGAEFGAWMGPMSVSADPGSLPWPGWAAIAHGDQDDFWHAFGRNLKLYREGRGTTYVSPFYEFNGDWMPWSVRSGEEASFRAGFARVAGILRQEFPAVKIVLPAACSRGVPAAMIPASDAYDLGGCTLYNNWPWSEDGAQAMERLEVGRARAEAAGKPFGITEWANAANPNDDGGGGDGPDFISAMHDWMVQHAGSGPGQLVFEAFFNIDGYSADHQIWSESGGVSTTQPRTAERYRDLY